MATSFPSNPESSPSSATPGGAPSGLGSGAPGASSSAPAVGGADNRGDLLNRVVEGAHHAIDRLADSAAPHVQRLQQGVNSASDTLHERAGQAREMGDEWAESLRCTVRENPLAAVATALVVGVLIARLTQR